MSLAIKKFTKTVIPIESVNAIVNITSKRGWIHRARKSENYEGDEMDKQKLIDILWSRFGISAIRPEPIMTIQGKPIYPDVKTTNLDENIYFEMDGLYHGWGDEITTTDYTFKKQQAYKDLGHTMITINKEATNGYETDLIIELLEAWGLKKK